MTYQVRSRRGFTLVELSIVIVIIGLIIAGVTAGQSLVRQARLQSVLSEKSNFTQAIMSFKLQYNALPGDITNASSYWPSCTAPNCNGNGNRAIWYPITNGSNAIEALRMWQHLNLAGLIPGNYTGVASVNTYGTVVGQDAPGSAMPKLGWYVRGGEDTGAVTDLVEVVRVYGKNKPYTSYLAIGSVRSTNNFAPDAGGFTPQEAYSIDSKIDDGIANKGYVMTGEGWSPSLPAYTCISAGLAYLLTNTSKSCTVGFLILR